MPAKRKTKAPESKQEEENCKETSDSDLSEKIEHPSKQINMEEHADPTQNFDQGSSRPNNNFESEVNENAEPLNPRLFKAFSLFDKMLPPTAAPPRFYSLKEPHGGALCL